MEALGRAFDVVAGVAPVDLNTAAVTGNLVHLKNAGGVTIVAFVGAQASGTETLVLDLQESDAASGGTPQDLDIITSYYIKKEATLDGDETWTEVTQTAASEITIAGADRDKQLIVVIEVDAAQLSDGFEWVGLNVADPGAVARLGAVLYLLRDLNVQRSPANLANPQA